MNARAKDIFNIITKVDEMILSGKDFEEVDQFMKENSQRLHGTYKNILPTIKSRYDLDIVKNIRKNT